MTVIELVVGAVVVVGGGLFVALGGIVVGVGTYALGWHDDWQLVAMCVYGVVAGLAIAWLLAPSLGYYRDTLPD